MCEPVALFSLLLAVDRESAAANGNSQRRNRTMKRCHFHPRTCRLTALLVALLWLPRLLGAACPQCETAGYPLLSDVNGDGKIDVSDPMWLLGWLFLGSEAPACPPPVGGPEEIADAICCPDCGDVNVDGAIDLSDPLVLLGWLFLGGDPPGCAPLIPPAPTCDGASRWAVDGAWLEPRLGSRGLQVLDVRSASEHAAQRIPSALYLSQDILRATIDGIPGQVAPQPVVETALRAAGVSREAVIVVYGSTTDTIASRVVWTLAFYGHADARLLDGGLRRWLAENRPVARDPPPPPVKSDYAIPGAIAELRVDAEWVAAHLDDPSVLLFDARSSGEYAAGHIPGAFSTDWQRHVVDGAFRPLDEVRALYPAIPPGATLVAYCQTGSRASVVWNALLLLGYTDVRLYDGSWSEWGSRPDLPKETGGP